MSYLKLYFRRIYLGRYVASICNVDASSEFYACGFSDGTVAVYHCPSFKNVSLPMSSIAVIFSFLIDSTTEKVYVKLACHQFPVTGLSFSPQSFANSVGELLNSKFSFCLLSNCL
jgi:hypothetical protein